MPQSIFEGKTYIGETIGSYRGDFDSGSYTGAVPVEDPLTLVPVDGNPEVVLSTVTDTVWLLDEDAVATPYYVDSGLPPADAVLDWPKIPVWNWVEGGWVQLNAAIDQVDYSISNIEYDRAFLTIFDHRNFDYLDFELTITGPGVSGTPIGLADDTRTFWITGLTAGSTYTVNLKVNLLYGGQSNDSIQTFTTPANPTPLAVIDLSSPARTNRWIDLKWTSPSGTTATSYKVYQGYYGGQTKHVKTVAGTSTRLTNLVDDRKYRYFVRGVNASGKEGPWSNELRWATGHGEIKRQGSDNSLLWTPVEQGSYRQDIQWRWAQPNGILPRNPHLYQGYWPGTNWVGAANPAQNPAAGRTRRYWGTIRYDNDAMIRAINRKHGAQVGENITISGLKFKKLYRHRKPGIVSPLRMNWHLTQANPFDSGQPPTYGSHWGANMGAGTAITGYGLPASWGTNLLRGKRNGTKVNGLVLHRSDDQTNNYGAAGYGAWSGHNLRDPLYSGDWRRSDLRLVMKGSWSVVIRAYKGPYKW